jgi:hypothetical protein
MLSVSYAECQLCCVSVMLDASSAECQLCWMSVMLSVIYAVSYIQALYAECQYVECHYAEWRGTQASLSSLV